METIDWENYPEEISTQEAEYAANAEAAYLEQQPCIEDPYNVSIAVLIHGWLERRSM